MKPEQAEPDAEEVSSLAARRGVRGRLLVGGVGKCFAKTDWCGLLGEMGERGGEERGDAV